jgi:hypothetical protein
MEKYDFDEEIYLNLSIGYSNAVRSEVINISDHFEKNEWDNFTVAEQEDALQCIANDWSENFIDVSFAVYED